MTEIKDRGKSYCCNDFITDIVVSSNGKITTTPICVSCCKFPVINKETMQKAIDRLKKYEFAN